MIQLNPELTPDTPIAEWAYAAMLNKSEVEASALSHEQQIQALAKQWGISSWSQGLVSDWQRALTQGWINFADNCTVCA